MARSVVSHYELEEKIGEGGYGVVYKARDLHVPRTVALKFVYPHLLESEQVVRRFQEEARAVCSLSHPNIVVLHDLDMDPDTGRVFLVLEFLGGGTLRKLIKQVHSQGLPFRCFDLCRYSRAIASGLAHAHRHGIIHRDVKSSNVMFSEEGVVKITDFGLAKSEGKVDLTAPGCAQGTLNYMSPEQARGLEVDHRTDIFSLGVVLYEMATGRLPFSAPGSYEVLHKIMTEPTPSLKEAGPDLPEELDRIIQRATAKQPAERYQRMEEMETELAVVEDKLKKLSEQPTEVMVARPEKRPFWRRWMVAPVLFALAALAGSGLLWYRSGRAPAGAPAARTLAVIPFQCLGKGELHQAFCDGLANTVSMKLTQMEALQDRVLVVPFSETRREAVTSAAEARKVFKVNLAVTGSVEFLGEAVRVIVNLVDAEKKIQTASDKVDFEAGSLVRLQDETSTVAASMLELRLTPANRQKLSAGHTQNEEAFSSFVRGLGYLIRSSEIEDVRRATELLERAVAIDPSYALAHAHLGEAYLRQYQKTQDGRWVDRARESCERAMKINGQLAQVYITLAQIHLARTDPERAIEDLKVALRLEPRNADALRELGNTYARLGVRKKDAALKEAAVSTFREAIALRPDLWTTYSDLGLAYYSMGEKQKAEEQLRRAVELTESADAYRNLGALYHAMDRPEDAIACLRKSLEIKPTPEAYANLGTVYYYLKRYAEVIPNCENALRLSEEKRTPDHRIWGNLAMAYLGTPGMEAKGRGALKEAIRVAEARLETSPKDAGTHASLAYYLVRADDRAGAQRHAAQAMELAPDSGGVLFRCALVYERLKRRDQALETLKRAIEKGHPTKEVLNVGDLAALRNDPRFKEFLSSGK
jgi:serine/threonine-protein kinase